jgi:Flp pilus assembly protein TadG
MRDLLRSRRGSAAFVTVIALVPLIGFVALGAEAGSWYVTHQHAQNAADAAAYSGALRLACTIAGATCDTQSVDYRSKEFAAQNGFCNSSPKDNTLYPGSQCAPSLPSRISRAVQIDIGDYNGTTFTTPPAGNGNAVRARVSQQQPAYLAAVLGLTAVNIPAQAIAVVQLPSKVCALALGPDSGALKLAGSLSNNGTGCPLMSDTSVQFASAPTFTGSGWAVFGVSGCTPPSTNGACSNPGVPHNYFMPYAFNPLTKLDQETFNSATTSKPADPCPTSSCIIQPNSPTTAYGNLTVTTGKVVTFTSGGTYFFYNAAIKINAGTVTGTNINIVLLGDSSISITGGAVSLSANMNNTSYPDLSGVLIDDQAPSKSKNAVTVNGGGKVALGGAMYFPHVDVTWSGSTANANTTCSQVIAKTLSMSGGAYLSTQGCAPATIAYTQVVTLVQ